MVDTPIGHIFKDWLFEDGVPCLIIRGPRALIAFVGIPKDHPLTAYGYNNIPLRKDYWENSSEEDNGYYWYGWDYDNLTYTQSWTVKMVENEIKEAAANWQNFSILMAKRLKDNETMCLERM